MSFWERLFRFFAGLGRKQQPGAPAKRASQPAKAQVRPAAAQRPAAPPAPPPEPLHQTGALDAQPLEAAPAAADTPDLAAPITADIPKLAPAPFLESLRAQDAKPLSATQIGASAERLGCEIAAVRAVLQVESRGSGFGADGRPIILFEPHVFSRLTNRRFDASNPSVSYRTWNPNAYPKTQDGRWAQLAEAYTLDGEAALGAASWGLFQILGLNYGACGFGDAHSFVGDMAISHEHQLMAFEAFVRTNRLVAALQTRDWARFARGYNGPGQVEKYSALLDNAYRAAGGTQPAASPPVPPPPASAPSPPTS